MARTHDSLNRRSRFTPTSTGKRVVPRTRALIYFEALHRHGSLSSSMLHAFTQHLFRDETITKKRLRDLFHENNTPHGERYWERGVTDEGQYLTRPDGLPMYRIGSRIEPLDLFYDLRYEAQLALQDPEDYRWRKNAPKRTASPKHDAFQAYVTANEDLVCQAHSDQFEYLYHDEIVDRIGVRSFTIDGKIVTPDAFSGIRYLPSRSAIIFINEVDRNTQPLQSKKEYRHKKIAENLGLYEEFFRTKQHEEYFGKGASVMVRHYTVNARHMQNMMDELGESIYQLFKCVPEFGADWNPPGPNPDLFFEPWLRPGKSPFDISNP